jgi:hypothetical protein
MERQRRAAVFALLFLGSGALAACLQVAGLGDYDEVDDGGASTDGSVVSVVDAGDAGVVTTGDATPPDGSPAPTCGADFNCPSGTVCDKTQRVCEEASGCSAPPNGSCGTFPQCGCMAAQSCVAVIGASKNSCLAAGTVAQNGTCVRGSTAASETCQLGFGCFDNRCLAFCDPRNVGSATGCGVGEVCYSVASSPAAAVCVPTCSPLSDKCPSNCDFLPDLNMIPVCVQAGTAALDAGCQPGSTADSLHCAPSLVCGPNSVCDYPVMGPSDCAAGTTYTPIYGLAFGYCAPN